MTWDEVRDAISAHEARTLALPLTRGQRFEAIRLSATIKDVCYHLRYHDAPPPLWIRLPQTPDDLVRGYSLVWGDCVGVGGAANLDSDRLLMHRGHWTCTLPRHQCAPCEPFIEALAEFAEVLRRAAS